MKRVALVRNLSLFLVPTVVTAGASYDLIFHDATHPTSVPLTSRHFVQDGEVRIELPQNNAVIFNEQSMYIIDYTAKTMRVQAPRDQTVAKRIDQISQMRAKAQTSPPEQQAKLEQVAQVLDEMRTSVYRTVQREYAATAKTDMVDGHRCNIWTETEEGAKRLELCVAAIASVPGGDQILAGMKTLSRYAVFGSLQALGVGFGHSEWWAGIEKLNGLPVLIREFQDGRLISETTITNVHQNVPAGPQLDIPKNYPTPEEGRGMPSN